MERPAAVPPMRLLLFDIDGTLVRCGRQVRVLFAEALREVFGTEGDLDGYNFSGKADPQIVRELMVAAGVAPGEGAGRRRDAHGAYLGRLEARLGAVEVSEGVAEAMAALAGREDLAVGLVTGNWRRGAGTKLDRAGLTARFAFG